MRRFFIPVSSWEGAKARLDADQCRHIARVLRMGTGDMIEVFDGESNYEARLLNVGKKGGFCEILKQTGEKPAKKARFILAPALIKAKRMDMVIEKATELGVDRIAPFVSERSVPKPAPERRRHWRKIAESAAAQSGRPDLPIIDEPVDFKRILAIEADLKLLLCPCKGVAPYAPTVHWEGEKHNKINNMLSNWLKTRGLSPLSDAGLPSVILLVGPEGGFTAEEVLLAQKSGFIPSSLAPLTLRAETASIAGLSILVNTLL